MDSGSKNKTYLFVLPWTLSSVGGVNQVVKNLYKQVDDDGRYVPLLLVNSWDDPEVRSENIAGVKHFFLRLRSPWNSSDRVKNFLVYLIGFFRAAYGFTCFVKAHNVKVVNFHYCGISILHIAILKILGLFRGELVLSFHGMDLVEAKKSIGFERFLWEGIVRSADRIVTCSEALKGEFIESFYFSANKVVAIHNGVVGVDAEQKKGCVVERKKKYILNVATQEYCKGQDVLINAFSKFFREFDVDLIIIGRPGGAEAELRRLVDNLNISGNVELYEGLPHEDVLAFMENAVIFVLPSRREAFGIVILEAGLFAVPVVASDVGGVPEILSHGETGRLCPAEDVNRLAVEIRALLSSPGERVRLGTALRERVLSDFSWEMACRRYLDMVDL